MDQRLLDALNNLSLSLIEISDALKLKNEPSSATAKALKSGDFITEIKEINVGVKQLQKDAKLILSNQQTIMKMGKSKKEESVVDELGKDKKSQNNLKDGLGVIMLIAVAVLALGAAFKIIGDVNFLSVISLSIALPLLAIGFAKVHKTLKEVGFDAKKDSVNFIIAVTSIAAAITISSWILRLVAPISFTQALTAILISGMFTVLAFGMVKIVKSVSEIKPENIYKVFLLPILLPAMALSIAISSWALRLVTPISFTQALTAILIGGMFTVLSFGMVKIVKSVSEIKPENIYKVFLLPILLPAMALSIAISSWALRLVTPISFTQALTAILIGAMFLVISFGIAKLIGAFKNITPAEALKAAYVIPLILVAISAAIVASSYILYLTKDVSYGTLLKVLVVGLVLSVLALTFTPSILFLGKMNIKDLLSGALAIVLVATAVMVSSHILSFGNYDKYPDWKWSAGVALSMLVIGGAIIGIGLLVTSTAGIGYVALAAGAIAILGIAGTVVAVSYILGSGKYGIYPSYEWSKSVSLSLVAFGTSAVLLGTFITATLGIGAIALVAGLGSVSMVAQSIVDVSFILQKGKYVGGPTKEWAEGVGLAIGAFSPVYSMLMKNSILSIFGADNDVDNMGKAILVISQSMVNSAGIFYKNRGFFDFRIDPGYIKSLSSNVMDFARLITSLAQEQNKNGNVFDNMFGSDPISKTAKGMVRIASAFDALAKSINNFGGSLNNLNEVKLDMFRSLTGNLALLSVMDATMFNNMIDVLEKRSGVFAELLKNNSKSTERPTVNMNPIGFGVKSTDKKSDGQVRDSKGESQLQKLDKIIGLLANINKEVSGLDEYLQSVGNKDLSSSNSSSG